MKLWAYGVIACTCSCVSATFADVPNESKKAEAKVFTTAHRLYARLGGASDKMEMLNATIAA